MCRCTADLGVDGGDRTGRPAGAGWVTLPIGCQYIGTVLHELLHVLGFHHEHRRPDAREYTKVLWKNIESGERT